MSLGDFGLIRRITFICTILMVTGCASIWATRPTQEMSDMELAIQAAREVEADVLAPDLFRTALETSNEAKKRISLEKR